MPRGFTLIWSWGLVFGSNHLQDPEETKESRNQESWGITNLGEGRFVTSWPLPTTSSTPYGELVIWIVTST